VLPETDAVLIQRLRAGDADALRELYEAHYTMLWELAYTFVTDAAEDVVHDVFAAVWHRRTTLVIRDSLRVYLYGAVRHRALNTLRRDRLESRTQQAIDPDVGPVPGLGTSASVPSTLVELSALDRALRQAVDALPAGQRHAVLLHWRHGLSNAEVAVVMDISTNAATVQIARARATLRRALAPWLDPSP